MLKADAYGLGAAPIAARLARAGCQHFFTATAIEAQTIRPHVGEAMVAVLHGLSGGADAFASDRDMVPVLNSLDEVKLWAAMGRALGRRPAILHVDTGLSRLGLPPDELAALAADPALLDGIALLYVMSHLASGDRPGAATNERQRRRFATIRAALPERPTSLANSGGIFLGPGFASDLARPGAALFGLHPTPGHGANPMRPAVRLRAEVLQLRTIPAGARVGYDGTWRAARETRIATVGIGYADGWLRAGSNRHAACFDGTRVPLVGRVSMDLSTYDVTDAPGVAVGAMLDLIGPEWPLERVAAAARTAGYEVLTSLGQRAARTFHG